MITKITEISCSFFLVSICALISRQKRQGLEKDFILGALRTIAQLLLLGVILNWVFRNNTLPVTLGIGLTMTINAALHSQGRVQIKYKHLLLDNLTATALAIWPLAFLGAALLHSDPLWRVEIFLPLLGMLLGNTLNGISVGTDYFGSELKTRREEILSLLALGATRKEATHVMRNKAIKIAMTPTLNSMASMGLVSIPGMMTGQILAGNTPEEAAVTQVILMLLITAGTYSGTYLSLNLARSRKFTQEGIPCFG